MKKRMISLVLALAMILSLSVSVMAATPVIEKTKYEGRGYVEVEFTKKVQYKNLKVTVKNSSGTKMTTTIVEKDDDELTFKVKNLKAGSKYTYSISGIRTGKSGSYQTVKGSFTVPKWDPLFKEIDYDAGDRDLDIDFAKRVQYKNLKITLKDSAGKTIKCRVVDKDAREIELSVTGGLKVGKTYTLTISGIRQGSSGSYGTITAKFTAR